MKFTIDIPEIEITKAIAKKLQDDIIDRFYDDSVYEEVERQIEEYIGSDRFKKAVSDIVAKSENQLLKIAKDAITGTTHDF